MKIVDKGVLDSSFIDFSQPSNFAKKALYYAEEFGHYYCTKDYFIERESLNLFLMFYILNGSIFTKTKDYDVEAKPGDIILLDCRSPHTYGCINSGEFLWFHFNGVAAIPYVEHLYERNGIHYQGSKVADQRLRFQEILAAASKPFVDEPFISHSIDGIFSSLASSEQTTNINELLQPALEYISTHYDENISIDDLAAISAISSTHLIRIFRKSLGLTPHEYILLYRLKQSKRFLVSTNDSVERIAERCGFNSASHFARAFKKTNHMTPKEFRLIGF